MTPSTAYPWRVQFTEQPTPLLSRSWDVVVLGRRLAIRALESMIDDMELVGPVLCCNVHSAVHVPVASGTSGTFLAAEFTCRPHNLACPQNTGIHGCPGRFWLLPPVTRGDEALTDWSVLHHHLGLIRSMMSRQPDRPFSSGLSGPSRLSGPSGPSGHDVGLGHGARPGLDHAGNGHGGP